jgi:hypothetical protein
VTAERVGDVGAKPRRLPADVLRPQSHGGGAAQDGGAVRSPASLTSAAVSPVLAADTAPPDDRAELPTADRQMSTNREAMRTRYARQKIVITPTNSSACA